MIPSLKVNLVYHTHGKMERGLSAVYKLHHSLQREVGGKKLLKMGPASYLSGCRLSRRPGKCFLRAEARTHFSFFETKLTDNSCGMPHYRKIKGPRPKNWRAENKDRGRGRIYPAGGRLKPCVPTYRAEGHPNTTCFRNAVLGAVWAK